jgi:hypothetical protein
MNTIALIFTAVLFLFALIFGVIVLRAWKNRQYIAGFTSLLIALVMVLLALLILLVCAGTTGYDALVNEDLAATVFVTPLGSQQFQAKVVRPHSTDTLFTVAGDELYIDARILKWKPIANLFGLRTAYRLDRVSGRYTDLQDERTKVRTLFSLDGGAKPWDMFLLRTKYSFLSPVLDAQYGSATFAPMGHVRVIRILVTTSGLIARSD